MGWTVWASNPGGARFFAPVQTDPGDPASYTVGTRSLPRVKLSGHGTDHPPLSNTEVTERVELCLYCLWPVQGQTLPLPLYIYMVQVVIKTTKSLNVQ